MKRARVNSSGNREANLIGDVIIWNRRTGLGIVFSSQTVFSLPGGGDRSPDVAWVQLDRWQMLSQEDRQGFPPICPDFVIDLRSRSESLRDGKAERLKPLQEKMQEYIDCGLQLGWLINPQDQQVEIYRAGQAKELCALPIKLLGEAVLPGFELPVERFTN
jgi:Uma2 family endonuclease